MNTWRCPYCDRQLPDERAVCCHEAGHAVPDEDVDYSVCQHGVGFDEDCDLCDEAQS